MKKLTRLMKRYLYIVLILFSAILNCRAAYYGFRISNLNGGIKYHYGNGYLTCSRAGKVTPYFYVRDHLGSVRAALTQTGAVRQITNYYAYGTFMGDVSKGYVIKTDRYTGKELDREAGLDLYDYGARQYDATVGLFTSMDPMCEQYYHLNPYLYCAGNPVRYVDPGGRGTGTCHETVGSK